MKTPISLGLAFLLTQPVLALAAPAGVKLPDPVEILSATLEPPTVTYQGRVMVTQWYGKTTRAEESNVSFSPPDRYRWDFLALDGSVERTMVSDGSHEELYLPSQHMLLRGTVADRANKRMDEARELQLLRSNYQLSVSSTDAAGRQAWLLQFRPKIAGKPQQRLSVDRETNVILENRRYRPGGVMAALSRFTRFKPGEKVSEDAFALNIDSATTVDPHGLDPDFLSMDELRKATGQSLNLPDNLPGGFTFESADFFGVQGEKVRHVRYTDGLVILSIFQTQRPVSLPKSDAEFPAPVAHASLHLSSVGRILHWKRGRQHYTAVCDLSKDLLEQIAAALPADVRPGGAAIGRAQ